MSARDGVSNEKYKDIVEMATRLFAEHGVAATTMRMIASSVGIQPGSLYQYIDSKNALVEDIIIGHLDEAGDRFSRVVGEGLPPRQELEGLIRCALVFVQEDPDTPHIFRNEEAVIQHLPSVRKIKDKSRENHEIWISAIERGIEAGVFRPGTNARSVYNLVRDGLWMTGRWFVPSPSYPLDDLVRVCTALYLDGLCGASE